MKLMKPYRRFGYLGTFASNELNKVAEKIKEKIKHYSNDKDDRFSFIMNLDKSNQPGSHWVAVYIDPSFDRSLEYFDSFGDQPTEEFMKDIKKVINVLDPETYLKFKVNKIKQQRVNSDNCGYFAMFFLIKRYEGEPFSKITKYDEMEKRVTNKSEKEIKAFKKMLPKFKII